MITLLSSSFLSSACQADLQQQEELLYKERKERERIIASYKKKVEERKAQAEKVDRRVRYTWWYIDKYNSRTLL